MPQHLNQIHTGIIKQKTFNYLTASRNLQQHGGSNNLDYHKNIKMEIQLISGTFTPAKAEEFLTAIFKTKIVFHKSKIRPVRESE